MTKPELRAPSQDSRKVEAEALLSVEALTPAPGLPALSSAARQARQAGVDLQALWPRLQQVRARNHPGWGPLPPLEQVVSQKPRSSGSPT